MKSTSTTPAVPTGRLDGLRFFRVLENEDDADGHDFHYLLDRERDAAWAEAISYATECGFPVIEERTNQRLNDYVGIGVYGLCLDRQSGEITSNRLSGEWFVGATKLVATYNVEEI